MCRCLEALLCVKTRCARDNSQRRPEVEHQHPQSRRGKGEKVEKEKEGRVAATKKKVIGVKAQQKSWRKGLHTRSLVVHVNGRLSRPSTESRFEKANSHIHTHILSFSTQQHWLCLLYLMMPQTYPRISASAFFFFLQLHNHLSLLHSRFSCKRVGRCGGVAERRQGGDESTAGGVSATQVSADA